MPEPATARHCPECDQHVASRVVGREARCIECGTVLGQYRP